MTHDRVAHFVEGHHFFLVVLEHAALLLEASHHPFNRFVEIPLGHLGAVGPGRQEGRLIHQVGQIGTGKATGGLGDLVEVDRLLQLHLLGVDVEDHLATGEVGAIHQHLAIEAAWAQQGGIEGFGLVGGRQHDHRFVLGGKAIHLGEQLVKRLLPFVVATDNAHGASAALADGVEFVDENDARRLFLGLLKQIPHPGRTGAHKQLHKFGAGNDEEGHPCFPGDGLGEQGFTGAWGAHEQHALGNPGADGGIALRRFEEIDDLG